MCSPVYNIGQCLRTFQSKRVKAENFHVKCDENNERIFKELSLNNGLINNMPLPVLQDRCRELNMDAAGSKESLKKRLKCHQRADVFSRLLNKRLNFNYDAICVIDFEATCDDGSSSGGFKQEIIEFPAFVVDVEKREIIATFHQYVQPIVHTKLTGFCKALTGIKQSQVNAAEKFPAVLDKFENWFYKVLVDNKFQSFALLSDGSWDLAHYLAASCRIHEIPYPSYAKKWINIKRVFAVHYKKHNFNITQMLNYVGFQFKGTIHHGYDDAANIANLLIRLLIDGAYPHVNERLSWHRQDKRTWGQNPFGYVKIHSNSDESEEELEPKSPSKSKKYDEQITEHLERFLLIG